MRAGVTRDRRAGRAAQREQQGAQRRDALQREDDARERDEVEVARGEQERLGHRDHAEHPQEGDLSTPDRGRVRLDVRVGPGDLGRVIGRRGRTAQSIRTVVRAAATRDDTDVDIEFLDD